MIKLDLKFGVENDHLTFTTIHKELIREAGTILIDTLNSPIFKDEVLTYKWKRKRGRYQHRFNHTQDSRALIYEKIISGNDKFSGTFESGTNQIDDGDMDVWLFPYYAKNIDTVGKTNTRTYKTWLNLNNFNRRIEIYQDKPSILLKALLAQNMIHEYCHNLGYKHRGNKRKKHNNKYSVPDGVGDIVKKLIIEKHKKENMRFGHAELVFIDEENFCIH